MTSLAVILLVVFFLYYCWFVLRVRIGLDAAAPVNFENGRTSFVSVVVAARNEEKNIQRCIRSLVNQTFSKNDFEVIVVDDNSSDKTREVVADLARSDSRIRLLQLPTSKENEVGRKPQAIALGIQNAKGEVIATTDADCVVPQAWLENMLKRLTQDTAFIAGPVLEKDGPSLLSKLESLEFMSLIVTGAGLIGFGHPIICNGANLMYRKSAFQDVKGFDNAESSCDDETLMQRIALKKSGKIKFCLEAGAIVETASQNNIRSFWSQRVRWAAKKGRYGNPVILIELVALYLFFLVFLLSAITALFVPALALPVAIIFGLKALVDFVTLSRGANMLQQRLAFNSFFLAELLHAPYIVVAAAQAQFAAIQWKGRTLTR